MELLNASAIAREVRSGWTSAETVLAETLARIALYDQVQPQAWIARTDPEVVMEAARRVDARVAAGEDLPLAGAPFAVKDNIDVAGLPTTAACPAFAYLPETTATVAARLEAAGAVMVGKTNLDQFATGLVGVRSPYGAPGCVFNRDYVSGGSSSGSAVAVGAGLVAFALGTDTAGSGRVPAAFNGLVGLKPSKGRWSSTGLVPACRSLDCITVFATDVADAVLIDSVAAGFDAADPYSRRDQQAGPFAARFKVGVPLPRQRQFFGDEEAAALYASAIERITGAGGELVEIDIGFLLETAELLYSGPWVAERTAAVEDLLQRQPGAIHPVVRAVVQAGAGVTGVEAFRGQYALQAQLRRAEAMWAGIDALMLPTAPAIYRIREVLADPFALNSRLGLYTNFVNLLDMAGVAVPAGFRANGTGFGVTLIGPAFSDLALFDLAARYEAAGPMGDRPALDLEDGAERVRLAVVGAHLAGMPLHWQLTSRDARMVARTRTAPVYKLFAMADSTPPKPALIHSGGEGAAIEVEVFELGLEAFGSFAAEVPPPLAIGTVTLEDGSSVKGFVAEPRAMMRAEDITRHGGWRAYMASLK